MANLTVLVVDDEARMRKLIKDFLVKKDYKILEAEDGEKALNIYNENKNKINLILLSHVFYTYINHFFVMQVTSSRML